MRKQTRSWFVYIAFGIIIVVFVFFYGWRGDQEQNDATVAVVNGEKLTRRQYEQAYENLLMFRRNLAENRSLNDEEIKQLRRQALDDIIERTVMLQEAARLGITVGLDEVRRQIADTPAFQRDGRFDKDIYLRQLAANRMSPGDYEKAMQTRGLIAKLVESVENTAKLSERELYELYRLEQEKVNLAFIKIDAARYEDAVAVTQDDLASYYEKTKEDYRVPDQVRVRHLVIDPRDYESGIQIPPEEVEQFYRLNIDRFAQDKKVKARHILIEVDASGGPEAEASARARAEGIKKELDEGKDFAKLAAQHSRDPLTASKGGDLGYFERGQMLPEFDEAAFSLKPGEVSAPVRTAKGFHIIKVEAVQEAMTQPLEAVRPVIEGELRREKASEVAKQAARLAVTKSYRGGSLVDYARDNGLKLKESGLFAPGDPIEGIGINKECSDAIFTLKEGEITPPVSAGGGYHVFQLMERKTSYLPGLAEVKEKIEKLARRAKAAEAARGAAEGYVKELSSGAATMEALAKKEQLTVDETGFFSRRSGFIGKIGPDEDLSRDAFALTSEKPYGPRVYGKGVSCFVVMLKDRQEVTRETFIAEQAKQRDMFLPIKRNERVKLWLDGLKARAQTEILLTL
jgi:peptidyl-prolyl cis-trans isomerase D